MRATRRRINRAQALDLLIEITGILLTIKIKRDIALARGAHVQQTHWHGQVHPVLARVGEYAALLAAGLEDGGVCVRGEDEHGLEGLERDEGAYDGGRGHCGGFLWY